MTESTKDAQRGGSGECPAPPPPVIIERRRRTAGRDLVWLVPIAALIASIWIAVDAWSNRGPVVTVVFQEIHGLETGDAVRCLGVEIGRVERIEWSASGPGSGGERSIRVISRIASTASDLLRGGAEFWIERPEFGYEGVRGLDTVVGPRYLALSPGTGRPERGPFAGRPVAPIERTNHPGDLEILIESSERRGMRRGGSVTYRGLPAGRILGVEIASDASRVEARVIIDHRYAKLIRDETRFYSTSGVSFEFGLDGLRADVDSLEALFSGGIAFATPPKSGDRAANGSRFELADRAEAAWLEWRPGIALVAESFVRPIAVQAALRWTRGMFDSPRSRRGWLTRIDDEHVAVPETLLDPPKDAREPMIECAGVAMTPESVFGRIRDHDHGGSVRILPTAALPGPVVDRLNGGEPVEVGPLEGAEGALLIWSDPGDEPLPVRAADWSHADEGILLGIGLEVSDGMVGSPVAESASGRLIGFLVPVGDRWMVTRVPSLPGDEE